MLKKISWIAALFFALAILFTGCTEAGLLDDGSAPAAPEPLVIDGEDLEFTAIGGNTDQIKFDGNLIKFTGATSSVGFSFPIPAAAADYTKFIVSFKVVKIESGRPGLLIKRNNKMENVVGITSDQDPRYQFCDVTGDNGEIAYNFEEGMEWDTGEWLISGFDGVVAFQHQYYVPSNNTATYTLELLNVVFPGKADAKVIFDADGGEAVKTIVVEQGKEIGDLPGTTKDGAAFAGWYIGAEEITSDWEVPYFGKDDKKEVNLKAKWVTTNGITKTATSLIHFGPGASSFTAPGAGFTVNTNGPQFTIDGASASWNTVTFNYHDDLVYYNLVDPNSYNIAEFTVKSNVDYTFQLQAGSGGDIFKYPSNETADTDNRVTLKADVQTTFAVALSDTGATAMRFQNTSNAEGNSGRTANITVISVVFTKGTLHTVTFGASSPINFSAVREQKILDGKKAKKPADPTFDFGVIGMADFLGWLLDGKAYDFDTKVTKDIDLTPWFANAVNRIISFDLGGLKTTIDGIVRDRAPAQVIAIGSTPPTYADIDFPAIITAGLTAAEALSYRWMDGTTPITNRITTATPVTADLIDDTVSISKDLSLSIELYYKWEIAGLGEIDREDIIKGGNPGDFTVDGVKGGISVIGHNWQWRVVQIPIDLSTSTPTGKTLADLKSVKLKITGVTGDATGSKSYYLLVGTATKPIVATNTTILDNEISGAVATGNVANGTAFAATFTVDQAKVTALGLGTETSFNITIHADMGTSVKYTLTDWEFVW